MFYLRGDIHWPIKAGNWGLSHGEVQVWYADLDSFHDLLGREILSAEELARAEQYRFGRDARLFLARRSLLRCLLAAYLDIDPAGIAFQVGPHGKPYLAIPGGEGISFSVSHSSVSALFTIGCGSQIGVDLEKERDDLDPMELATQFFAPSERLALELLTPPERKTAFFRTWTRKEAWLKAVGCGLSLPLIDFQVSIKPGESLLLDCPLQFIRPEDWHLIDLQTSPGFAATLACKSDCTTLYSGTIFAN
jgi:4'-phosphopantetheinyl transferase